LAANTGTTAAPNFVLVGIVQSGTVVTGENKPICGAANEFGIYTSVQQELPFIQSVLAGTAGTPSDSTGDTSGGGGGGGGTGILACFHIDSMISYKGGAPISMDALEARSIPECLVPHTITANGVRVYTDCSETPLRLSNEHLVFSLTHGLVQAHRLSVGDIVYGNVEETKLCKVLSVTSELNQKYKGLNCRESVVLANGVKCSTFEAQHIIPSLWMKYVPSVLGLERASRVGEILTNFFRAIHLA